MLVRLLALAQLGAAEGTSVLFEGAGGSIAGRFLN